MIHELDLSDFGYMEIDQLIDILKAQRKVRGQIHLNSIIWNNSEPSMIMLDDMDNRYEVRKGKLVNINPDELDDSLEYCESCDKHKELMHDSEICESCFNNQYDGELN